MSTGSLIISLDFELAWGLKQNKINSEFIKKIYNTRNLIPQILEINDNYDIHATWATVGFLFAKNKEELMSFFPVNKPIYKNKSYNNYFYVEKVGKDEKKDPLHFGQSIIKTIANYKNQEIASHTFSHLFCLEEGLTNNIIRQDLIAAKTIAEYLGFNVTSLVFPRNQYNQDILKILKELDFNCYRGNLNNMAYFPRKRVNENKFIRSYRYIDRFIDISNKTNTLSISAGIIESKASLFLAPFNKNYQIFNELRLNLIKSNMKKAAISGKIFHLWWHPHNFSNNTKINLYYLSKIYEYFSFLRNEYGMISKNMGELTHEGV